MCEILCAGVAVEIYFAFMWENVCKSVNVLNFAHPHTCEMFLMHGGLAAEFVCDCMQKFVYKSEDVQNFEFLHIPYFLK